MLCTTLVLTIYHKCKIMQYKWLHTLQWHFTILKLNCASLQGAQVFCVLLYSRPWVSTQIYMRVCVGYLHACIHVLMKDCTSFMSLILDSNGQFCHIMCPKTPFYVVCLKIWPEFYVNIIEHFTLINIIWEMPVSVKIRTH